VVSSRGDSLLGCARRQWCDRRCLNRRLLLRNDGVEVFPNPDADLDNRRARPGLRDWPVHARRNWALFFPRLIDRAGNFPRDSPRDGADHTVSHAVLDGLCCGLTTTDGMVRGLRYKSCKRKWRARQDLNLRPPA
jgi:hypothetical protein